MKFRKDSPIQRWNDPVLFKAYRQAQLAKSLRNLVRALTLSVFVFGGMLAGALLAEEWGTDNGMTYGAIVGVLIYLALWAFSPTDAYDHDHNPDTPDQVL